MQFLCCTLLFVAVISVGRGVLAQTASNEGDGALKGTVVDWQKARVATTTILIENKTLKRRISVDEIGEFQTRLPVGRYRVTAEAPGFKRHRRNIVIRNGATEFLNIKLRVSPQSLKCPPGTLCL